MNIMRSLSCRCALLLACGGAGAATNDAAPASDAWPAFVVDWRAGAPSPADVSFLLEAPAGKDGFLRAKDGHLVRPDGRRFRIWGINATGPAGLPSAENATLVAEGLARHGINAVRFHFLDKPGTLIDNTRDDTGRLDPAALDRLDRFVAELKKRGIYSDLNLNVYRTYKPGDGVRDAAWLGIGKGATYFNPRLLELQREYARALLTHTNAYTGRAYREEPAVAAIEFVNENALVESWFGNHLLGTQTNKASGTWSDIPPSYAAELTEQFNVWLAKRFPAETLARWRQEAGVAAGAPLLRLRREQFEKAAADRFEAEASFYTELQRDFFAGMARFLREELGVKSLLIGDSDHNHGGSGYPLVASMASLDVIDGHVYWQHPNYTTDPKGRRQGFNIANSPMADDPAHSAPVQLSRSAVAGKPYTVSEVNHPFPAEYACEGVPVLAAYAALQDWDGIFWYTLGHDEILELKDLVRGHFDFAKDPVKMSQLAAGALLFARGDVAPARTTVGRSYSRAQTLESLRLPRAEQPYFTPGFPLALPLVHAVRVTSFDGPPTGAFEAPAPGPVVSDTGELTWRSGAKGGGLVVVDAPRSQALVGRVAGPEARCRNLRAEMQTPFCALTLGALDGKPLAESARLLLTATARVANSGMKWNEKRASLDEWGSAPTRIEPVAGRIVLTGLAKAKAIAAQPLDGGGRPRGAPLPLARGPEGWTLELGHAATTWFVLEITR